VIPALQRAGVLQNIQRLQTSLDPTDISDLAKKFKEDFTDVETFDNSVIPELQPDELGNLIDLITSGTSRKNWTFRQRLLAYSLSAIFKDCSIFIQLPIFRNNLNIWESKIDQSRVRIIDLDLKPMTSLRHWYDLDTSIWTHWRDTHPETVVDNNLIPPANSTAGLTVPDNDSTRALFTPSGRVSPISETGESSRISTASRPAGDDLLGANVRHPVEVEQRERKESDRISLGGALAISPTRSEIGSTRRPSLGVVLTATNGDTLEEKSDQDGSTGIDSQGADSPVVAREARSLAPSPSPHPDTARALVEEPGIRKLSVSTPGTGSIPSAPTGDLEKEDTAVEPSHPNSEDKTISAPVGSGSETGQPESMTELSGLSHSHSLLLLKYQLDNRQTSDSGSIPLNASLPHIPPSSTVIKPTPDTHNTVSTPLDIVPSGVEPLPVFVEAELDDSTLPSTVHPSDDVYHVNNSPRSAQRSSGQTFGGSDEDGTEKEDFESAHAVAESVTTSKSLKSFSLGPPIASSATSHPYPLITPLASELDQNEAVVEKYNSE